MVEFIDAIHSKFVPIPTNYTQAKPSFSNVDNEDLHAIFLDIPPRHFCEKKIQLTPEKLLSLHSKQSRAKSVYCL
jgi:hypothetical protein